MSALSLDQIVALYCFVGIVLFLFAAIRSYQELDASAMLIGLLLCLLIWPLIILGALYAVVFRKNDNA